MCSTSNNDENGVGFEELSPTSFKKQYFQNNQKRQRVPKRGPGVAELEKILREQEKITTVDQDQELNDHSSFVLSPISTTSSNADLYLQHTHNQRYFPRPLVPINNNNNNNNNNNGANNYSTLNCSNSLPRPSQVVPFRPLIWTNQNMNFPNPHFHSPTSVISPFAGSASPLSIPSSVGFSFPIEPPSSQRPRHNCKSGQQDPKFIGMKRPLSVDQMPPLPPQKHRAPEKHSSNICKQIPRESDFNYIPSCNMKVHEGNFYKFFSTNMGTSSASFQVFQPQFPKFDPNISQQDVKQNSTGTDLNKPFYSFLPSNDPTGKRGVSYGVEKSTEDGIDLNLRLSTI